MSSYDSPLCFKCGEPMPDGHDWHAVNNCIYTPCDSEACRALRNPVTSDQIHTAYLHWRHHSVNGTSHCSHGRAWAY